MRYTRLFTLLVVFLQTLALQAQREVTAEGYARIEQGEKTETEARHRVLQQAQFDAINKAFGSNITQNSITMSHDENGKTTTTYYLFGESDLRGIWISDTEKPKVIPHIENGRVIWEAWVKGKIREQTRAKIEFEWKLLANGTDDRYQVKELHEKDKFYVSFRSAVPGYLLLFMVDDKDRVSCLLPEEGLDYCQAEANQWLIFCKDNPFVATLPVGKRVEYDQLYVIFSPNKIEPPIRTINDDDEDLKRYNSRRTTLVHVPELSFNDFHKYLNKLLHRDTEAQHQKMLVKISKR